jgi:predicted nucleotidyltransferase
MNRSLYFEYLDSVTNFLKRDHEDKLVSIILFGSLVNLDERITISTDADLLVILRNSCTSNDFQRIKRRLIQLEFNLLPNVSKESKFIRGLQIATGMFCNFFVCRFSDFQKRNFYKVFNVNSFIGAFLAPQNSVWLSLYRQHRVLWGKNVFQDWQTLPIISNFDIIRSFLMNCLLATGALFIFPFNPQMAKFSMEAMKWSLFTWKNTYFLTSLSLTQILGIYINQASRMEQCALHEFIEYRKSKRIGKFFPFLAWIFVVLLHQSIFDSRVGRFLEFLET